MTFYIQGAPALSQMDTISAIELRVISNLIQAQSGNQQQDELRLLRNDQAFELGIVPPVVPGN